MARDKCANKLRKYADIISDVQMDVSLLLPLLDNFDENIIENLREMVEQGKQAKRLLEKL